LENLRSCIKCISLQVVNLHSQKSTGFGVPSRVLGKGKIIFKSDSGQQKKTNKIQETQGKELLENQPKKIALDRAWAQ